MDTQRLKEFNNTSLKQSSKVYKKRSFDACGICFKIIHILKQGNKETLQLIKSF